MPRHSFAVILAAAGRATRFGGEKLAVELDGRSVFSRSLRPFLDRDDVALVVAVTDPRATDSLRASLSPQERDSPRLRWCNGGRVRTESVREGLAMIEAESRPDFVAVHDAARPAASTALIDRVFAAAAEFGAAIPAVPVIDTIKRTRGGFVAETLRRAELAAVQTPQAMRRDWLIDALARCPVPLDEITDDAQLLELAGYPVRVVDGEPANLKLTIPEDLARLRRPRLAP